MESTTVIWMLTTSNLSLGNKTNDNRSTIPDHSYDNSDYVRKINGKFITLSLVIISINLLIIFLLLTSKDCRRKPFFWHVISLSVWFVLVGVFLLPLALEIFVGKKWVHGGTVCRIWSVMWIQNLSITALIMFFASLDRMLAKVQLVTPLNQKVIHILNYVLVFFPWVFVVTINVPLTLSMEKDINFSHMNRDQYCIFTIFEEHFVKATVIFYMLPLSLLALIIFILIVFYVLKEGSWNRVPSTTAEEEIVSLRMSTVAVWINCVLLFVSWFPATASFIVSLMRYRQNRFKCVVSYELYLMLNIFYEAAPAIISLIWFMTVELRASASSWIQKAENVFRNRKMKRDTSMSWLSRNRDDTTTT